MPPTIRGGPRFRPPGCCTGAASSSATADADVYCYKPSAPHYKIFTATGTYEIVWQQVWMDRADAWIEPEGRDVFESRWSDVVLRKSYSDYFASDGAE